MADLLTFYDKLVRENIIPNNHILRLQVERMIGEWEDEGHVESLNLASDQASKQAGVLKEALDSAIYNLTETSSVLNGISVDGVVDALRKIKTVAAGFSTAVESLRKVSTDLEDFQLSRDEVG